MTFVIANICKKRAIMWGIGLALVASFAFLEYVSYRFVPQYSFYVRSEKKFRATHLFDRAHVYFSQYPDQFEADEYLMAQKLWPDMITEDRKRFASDPFDRFVNDGRPISDFKIVRRADTMEQLHALESIFGTDTSVYVIEEKWRDRMTDPYDHVVAKALYCDVSGYDQFDFAYLGLFADHVGGYGDTHYAMALLALDRFGCMDHDRLVMEMKSVGDRIVAAAQKDVIFGDLFAERIVTLYWLGRGQDVQFVWIKNIMENQKEDGGFCDHGEDVANMHTTGLATLAVRYFFAGEKEQSIFGI